jgi:hypothetical protein
MKSKQQLSARIISKILKYYQDNVLDNSAYYEKKYNVERILFLKIFNLYTSMCFITVYNRCMVLSQSNIEAAKSNADVLVNTADVDREVEYGGVDLEVVKNNAFPQLMFENKAVIEKMFDYIKGDVDLHTRLLPFESFCSLVI